MIVALARAYVVARHEDREALLAALRGMGVLHLVPVHASEDAEAGTLAERSAQTKQALHVIAVTQPAGEPAVGEPARIVKEILELRQRGEELHSRLALLEGEAQHAARWGRVTRTQLEELRACGAEIQLVDVANTDVPALRASVVHVVEQLSRGRSLVILVRPHSDPRRLDAQIIPAPKRELRAVLQEITTIRETTTADGYRLAQLAQRARDVVREAEQIEEQINWIRARRAGFAGERLFGVQGWVPLARAHTLATDLAAAGISAAVHTRPARADERPPTLLFYPRWLRPIRGVFDLLGIRPGYDEVDVSAFFMFAVPLFAGMIIADAGYGLLFLLLPLLLWRRLQPKLGKEKLQLLMMFGAVALVWGAISGVWFGVMPSQLTAAGGWPALVGAAFDRLQLIRGTQEETRIILFKICFLLGSAHLILARVRRLLALAPHSTAIAELGWCGVLAAMLGLIWHLFFGERGALPAPLTGTLFGMGAMGFILVAGFSATGPALGRVAKGIGGALLPMISAFGDTLSYLRLAAVGLAGYYLAVASNTLAADAAHSATWVAGVPVLLVGHLLNIGLILIAIFAHGVRLNLLEFSSNAGIQWTGYAFRPFAKRMSKEH
jgi:V/A-type H+-transporting ATPase subunit I